MSTTERDVTSAGVATGLRVPKQPSILQPNETVLPEWFDPGLDPRSAEYRGQQLRLWQEISGRESPARQGSAASGNLSASRPTIFDSGDPVRAGEHLMAVGHLLRRSGLHRGATALEYGSCFDDIAGALTRLDVTVSTATSTADLSGVAADGRLFDLIYFYETLQHCVDFHELIPRLRDLLAPGGHIVLAAAPVVADDSMAVAGPWGVRLDDESVRRARDRGTMELGFQQSYLMSLLVRAGLVWERYAGPLTGMAELWVVSRRSNIVKLATHSLTPEEATSWHDPEPMGRWTRYRSWLHVDEAASSVEVSVTNRHPVKRRVTFFCAGIVKLDVPAGGRASIRLPQSGGQLAIECEPLIPRSYGEGDDARELGIFVETLTY